MTIYIDTDFKCYTQNDGTRREFEVEYFNGKCKNFIEGFRYVPESETWTRSDGAEFHGEMISPWRDYRTLLMAQEAYEEAKQESSAEIADMKDALAVFGVT